MYRHSTREGDKDVSLTYSLPLPGTYVFRSWVDHIAI